MKKLFKYILITLITIIGLIAIAGMIKFNILQDDIYVEDENGDVVRLNEK